VSNELKKIIIKAFLAGYQRGNQDTADSCYSRWEDKAEEYAENVERGIE
jgi:hypothetical protein